MTDAKALTSKGKRSAGRVLDAATTVLARDGFGGATLSRIADEAGLDKRTVLYYYGSREALLVRVVQTVGERIVQHIEATITEDADPAQMAETAVETLWAGVTSAPELARAYFALIGGGAGTPVVEDALRTLKQAYLRLILRQLQNIEAAHGRRLGDSDAVATFALAFLRGLLLEWTEAGDSEEVQAGLRRFKRLVACELALAPGVNAAAPRLCPPGAAGSAAATRSTRTLDDITPIWANPPRARTPNRRCGTTTGRQC